MDMGTGRADTSFARGIDGVGEASGTWERTARQVQVFAGELGIALDPRAVLWADVRDLMALRECLRYHLQHPASAGWRRQHTHPCCDRAHALLGGRPA